MKANTEKFSIFIPIELEKANEGEDRYGNMKFKGIASSPNFGKDKENQVLDPSGFDLNQFLSEGLINYHHKWKEKPTAIIGEPTMAKITANNEMYVEGRLYPSSQLARDVYDLAEIMEKDSSNRRMGFSIEGIPLRKDPKDKNRIIKAKITHLAITPAPICSGTRMEIVKGGIDDIDFDLQEGSEYIIDVTGEDGIRYRVDKNLVIIKGEDIIDKAMIAGNITGRDTTDQSLTQESLKQESVEGTKKKKKKKLKDLSGLEKLSKGETISELFSMFNFDIDSTKQVYYLIEQVQRQLTPDMAEITKVSPEAIQKALVTLGLQKAEDTIESAASKEEDKPTKEELKKAADAEVLKAAWKDVMAKAEEIKKQAAEVNITLDGGLLGDPNGGQITQKSEESQTLSTPAILSEELIKGLDEKFTSLGFLIQSKDEQLVKTQTEAGELKKANDALALEIQGISEFNQRLAERLGMVEKQPLERKSISTAKYVEKGFEKGGDSKQEGVQTLSLSNSKHRAKIADVLFDAAIVKGEVKDEEFAKAVEYIETSKSLGATEQMAKRIQSRLKSELNIIVIG